MAPLVAAAAFIAAGPVSGLVSGPANADLPTRTAAQLLVDIQKANLDGFSGTVVENANLGLPSLPENLGGSTGELGMLTGTHTMRVWSAGPERSRISLPSQYAESDLIRNGRDLWLWSSSTRSAEHWTLPAHAASSTGPGMSSEPTQERAELTPQQAADQALAALSPTTAVTGDGTTTVAGRPAYVLSLRPRSATTLIGSIQIAIDGATHVPTQVQIFAKGSATPDVSVGFSSFHPGMPQASVFSFNPPAGTTVKQEKLPSKPAAGEAHQQFDASAPQVIGQGWNAVIVDRLPADHSAGSSSSVTGQVGQLGAVVQRLPRVSGTWGSGWLFQGTLFSVVVTDSHQVAAGMVPPSQLYAALQGR